MSRDDEFDTDLDAANEVGYGNPPEVGEDNVPARREIDPTRKEYFTKTERESDFEFSRRIYYDIIAAGAEAVSDAMRVAQETEHPRAFEVLSKLIKDVGDTTDRLAELHKKQKEIERKEKVPEIPLLPGVSGEGGTFIMTTEALQKMLLGKTEKDVTPPYE